MALMLSNRKDMRKHQRKHQTSKLVDLVVFY